MNEQLIYFLLRKGEPEQLIASNLAMFEYFSQSPHTEHRKPTSPSPRAIMSSVDIMEAIC